MLKGLNRHVRFRNRSVGGLGRLVEPEVDGVEGGALVGLRELQALREADGDLEI